MIAPFRYPSLSITLYYACTLLLATCVLYLLTCTYKIWMRIEHARNISDTMHASASVTPASLDLILYTRRKPLSRRALTCVCRATPDFPLAWERNQLVVLLRIRVTCCHPIIQTSVPNIHRDYVHFRVIDLPIARTEERNVAAFCLLCGRRDARTRRTRNFAVKKNSLTSIYLSIGAGYATRETFYRFIDWSFRVTCALLHVASSRERSLVSTRLIVSLAPQVRGCLRRASRKWNFAPRFYAAITYARP